MYPSIGLAVSGVKVALYDFAVTALAVVEPQVQVAFGYAWPIERDDTVAVVGVRADPQEATVSPNRVRRQDVFVDVDISCYRVTDSDREVHDIAYGLLDLLDKAMRVDPTLAGAALWCFSDTLASDGATPEEQTADGREHLIRVTYRAHVEIRNMS
jgi:hypothetical protein